MKQEGSNFPVEDKVKINAEEAYRKIHRGGRALAFARSEFWTDDLKPHLEKMVLELDRGNRWTPRDQTKDTVALGVAYNSGGAEHVEEILKQVNQWIDQGEAAREALKKRKKENKK